MATTISVSHNEYQNIHVEYQNETTTYQKSSSKGEIIHPQPDSQARMSSSATKNGASPYLQKLPHSNFIQVVPSSPAVTDQRRQLRRARCRSSNIVKEQCDLLYSSCQTSTVAHLDLTEFLGSGHSSRNRPISAPIRKKKVQRTSIQKSVPKSRSFRITIYRNGDHNRCCHCTGTTLNAIFQYATEKLQMPLAARRLFDSDGQEIYRFEDIQTHQEYYVSSGENFRDPFQFIQIQTEYGINSIWTMKGIQTDAVKPDSFKTKTVISERLQKQIHVSISLTVIENGFGGDDAVHHILIDAVLKRNFEKFLELCTKKLQMNSHGRRAFNYRGEEIHSLKLFLQSQYSTMQSVVTETIYGPVWLSKGERFRPTGAYLFLELRMQEYQMKLKLVNKELDEVILVIEQRKTKKRRSQSKDVEQESSTDNTDLEETTSAKRRTVKNKSLLSMRTRELREYRMKLENQIKEITEQIEIYRLRLLEIEDDRKVELDLGAEFFVEHIKEVKFHDKIVGRHPLCLYIHENGSYRSNDLEIYLDLRSLSWKKVSQTSIEYLLNYLQTTIERYARQRPKRVFDIYGTEIKIIGHLKNQQHIFISFGEDYRAPFEPCLAIQVHSVDVYRKDDQLSLIKVFRMEDEVIGEKETRSAKQLASDWKAVVKIPSDVRTIDYENDLNADQKQAFTGKTVQDRVNTQVTFISKKRKLIYPELKVRQKVNSEWKPKSADSKVPQKRVFSEIDLQTWYYTKEGYIYNKLLDTLVLTVVDDQHIQLSWTAEKFSTKHPNSERLQGLGVLLKPRNTDEPDKQKWTFTKDGFIESNAYKTHALTSLATIHPGDDNSFAVEGLSIDHNNPLVFFVAICPKSSNQSAFIHRQRWGIRQESGFTIGDWKYSRVKNPAWHKLALTWPVDIDGQLIPDLQWPLEGCFIPGVPSITAPKHSQGQPIFVPIRLQVLKNGERDYSKATYVVGPDISNLILERKLSVTIYRRLRIVEPEKEHRLQRQMQRMADARQREIKLFLETCTEVCNLPFAARRLFDTDGTEIFDLTSIKRDSYVYVTCGEHWINPALTKAEQQRRLLLAYLSYDVRMIFFYCALRHTSEYVISAESSLRESSRLVLAKFVYNAKQQTRVETEETTEQTTVVTKTGETTTSHERSHKRTNQRANEKFRWPWEKMSGPQDEEIPTPFEPPIVPRDASTPPMTVISIQRFRWESLTGYISCVDDQNLVFGVKEIEGKVIDVILVRRNPDDIFQRWLFIPNDARDENKNYIDLMKPFLIVSKARPTMALTILLPSCTGSESNEVKVSCVGCSVTLQQRRYEENGCANQKWAYEERLGFFFPFNATLTDKEITAANRANICSYTVNYEALSQPGFRVSILNITDQAEDVTVCLACAQAMRGKYRLVKIEPNMKFACAIGKRHDLKFQGPFHCLNHKVDLTRDEALITLHDVQQKLEQLRQEASVRNIAKELAAAKTLQVVHLLAYRNGDGHTKPGQLLVGSSMTGLLDQATHRLSLTNAARRFYMTDGTAVLAVEDMIEWMSKYYCERYGEITNVTELKSTQSVSTTKAESDVAARLTDAHNRVSDETKLEKTTLSSETQEFSSSKQRFQTLVKPSDIKRAVKQNPETRTFDVDMKYLLKFPIEVWVSTGEPFVKPAIANQRNNQRLIQREQRTVVEHDFEREKHTLRLIKGRRISGQASGELVAQQNLDEPVINEGHWTQKSDSELDKQDDVTQLRKSLDGVRAAQKPESTQPLSTPSLDRLGQHSKMKHVMIYLNGEPKDTAVQCNASSLDELMANAKLKFNLMQPVQALFDEHGKIVERFDQLNRDQLVCVSTTKTFITAAEKQREVDVKANWARTRNTYGDQATDIRVNFTAASSTPLVDPYGPPLLTLDDHQQQRQRLITKTSAPPAVAPTYRRLAIEPSAVTPQTRTTAIISEVAPSPIAMKESLSASDDDAPNSEIQRITNAKEDESSSSRPMSSKPGTRAKLSNRETVTPASTRVAPSSKKSDSDDDDFIAMLKRK